VIELNRRQLLRTGGVATLAAAGGLALPARHAEAATIGKDTFLDDLVNDAGGQVHNVTNPAYGAKADTVRSRRGGAIAAGSSTFTHTTADADTSENLPVAFTAGDQGKVITVQGAGPSGGVLSTTIASVTSASTVVLGAPASSSVSDAAFAYGTDDTAAIVAAITAAGDEGIVYLPPGIFTIRGASNAGGPLVHTGRGGIRGRGGKATSLADPQQGSNSVLLCSDATAGLIANGSARYESFSCDGNGIATRPLQNGIVVSGTVTAPCSHAMFIDVWATGSAGTGWSINGGTANGYYDCGTTDNALDGLSIDGGASSLLFLAFRQHGDLRYGIRGDELVNAPGGTKQPTRGIRFVTSVFGDGDGRPAGTSTVYLRNAVDWRFPSTTIHGGNITGPTVDLDQTHGYGIDLSGCWISSSRDPAGLPAVAASSARASQRYLRTANGPGYACIQISGSPTSTDERLFLVVDGCHLLDGDTSIYVKGAPGAARYSATGGWDDTTRFGPAVDAGVPVFDSLFDGRTGPWVDVAAAAPWSGTVSFRVMAERWVELKGTVELTGSGTGPLLTLPPGCRPLADTKCLPVVASSGLAVAVVTPSGEVSVVPTGATPFPALADVRLDGASFTTGGA